MQKIRILLVGAGGYGELYVRLLAGNELETPCEWVGVVDPYAKRSGEWGRIEAAGVPVYDALDEFYAEHEADLAIISTPIPLHAPQCIAAMEHGSDVLLEKPIAGSSGIAREIIAARDRLQKKLFIGYQWCYDAAMLRFKQASDAGRFGRLRRLRSLVLWPRGFDYYARNNWAGRALVNGQPVYDSVSSNATAHYLFNMLWIAGPDYAGAAPAQCQAVTAKANDVETFDTAGMLFTLENGVEALHLASHAAGTAHKQEPMFVYEYEKAVVRFGGLGELPGHITAEFADGTTEDFGQSVLQGEHKLNQVLKALVDPSLTVICPAEAAVKHTQAIELARQVCPEAKRFARIDREEGGLWVDGLAERMIRAFEDFRLPDLDL